MDFSRTRQADVTRMSVRIDPTHDKQIRVDYLGNDTPVLPFGTASCPICLNR
jgi:hypothetical protein